ncbi:hypothetical protein SCA03_03950 [Streptomyces cacaoi]|uniref:Uncharacterized protein n=1 Tax=Streptomyces cacaoi TaxID=1898 RepID=A0A4Y3QR31_STRCI|nr:hypothetical protein SCA03_03950 [Streptomyces cacaoi]
MKAAPAVPERLFRVRVRAVRGLLFRGPARPGAWAGRCRLGVCVAGQYQPCVGQYQPCVSWKCSADFQDP